MRRSPRRRSACAPMPSSQRCRLRPLDRRLRRRGVLNGLIAGFGRDTLPTMTMTTIKSGLLAPTALLLALQAAPPPAESSPRATPPNQAKPPEPEAPSAASAEDAANAFIAATKKKDWSASVKCFAPEARDLVLVHLLTMLQFSGATSQDTAESLDRLLKEHGFDSDKAQAAANELMREARQQKQRPDGRKVIASYLETVKNREALAVALLAWADQTGTDGRRPAPPLDPTLSDLKVSGDSATANLTAGAHEKSELEFKRIDGAWLLTLPESNTAPSGWNDVFLFGYLDAVHGWRF